MKNILLLIICCITHPIAIFANYDLAICAIFHNEGPFLKEWIEYHQLVGVEHFYLYNNNSTDDYQKILDPYINSGVIELTDWPSPKEKEWQPYQKSAYNDCLSKAKKETEWLAIIDLDEFIVPVQKQSIPEVLKNYEEYGGVKVFWQMYGTSNLSSLPEGKLMIECLTHKSPWNCKKNHITKSIVRPSKVKSCNIHTCKYIKNYYQVTTDKQPTKDAKNFDMDPQIDQLRINHYWFRTEDFFYSQKIARKERANGVKADPIKTKKKLKEANSVEDTIMFKYVDELKKRMDF